MRHLKIKREAAQRAEYAVAHIIAHPGCSYRQVATMFQVSVNQVRGRIEARFGSLDYAREVNGHSPRDAMRRQRVRKCIVCGTPKMMEKNIYTCASCRAALDKQHDGHV